MCLEGVVCGVGCWGVVVYLWSRFKVVVFVGLECMGKLGFGGKFWK